MIEYLIGVDGGGSGTRVRVRRVGAADDLACGNSGRSGLMHGLPQAWNAIAEAIAHAFSSVALPLPALAHMALGLGLAGVHNKQWAAQFYASNPGYATIVLETDAYTTLLGAHQGRAGAIIALGTGGVGEALLADGLRREVGGWGFPCGDEASGAWLGLQAVNHAQQVDDGRAAKSDLATAVMAQCGGNRDGMLVWLASADQTAFARLAPLVVEYAASEAAALAIMQAAGRDVEKVAAALDPSGTLPIALCGGLAAPLRAYLGPELLTRIVPPVFDASGGALLLIQRHVRQSQLASPLASRSDSQETQILRSSANA